MDENRQAILLLSAQFTKPTSGAPTPLTALEYGRFASFLRHSEYQPKDLFRKPEEIFTAWKDPKGKVTPERLKYLLGRGMAMGVAVEKWQSAGIWILTRADREYPRRLKQHLGDAAPPVLFGVGDRQLLNAGGLAMVGSRDIGKADTEFTKQVAKQAALEGLNLVSGGARGVDEIAMLGALEIEGTAVGVLANDLYKSALAGKWRKYLKNHQLALVTPFYPEGRFQVGNAMGRNKYIYCLSDYSLVVRSDKDKGGTWAGATENLKNKWIPLFVASPSDADGNQALSTMGATELTLPEHTSSEWLCMALRGSSDDGEGQDTYAQKSQADTLGEPQHISDLIPEADVSGEATADETALPDQDEALDASDSEATIQPEPEPEPEATFNSFMQYIADQIASSGEVTFSDLKEQRTDITQKQIRAWLDQAVDAGILKRKGRLLSYTSNLPDMDQQGFNFD